MLIARNIYKYTVAVVIATLLAPVVPTKAFAEKGYAEIEPSDLFELKARLEESVVKKYRDRISTRLQPELFHVGAQITVTVQKIELETPPITPQQVQTAQTPSPDLPADISLGIISSIKASPNQVAQVPGSPLGPFFRDRVKIAKVELFVGLSPKLGSEYKQRFEKWLKLNVQSEFGGLGTANVNDYVMAPPEEKKEEPKPTPIVEPKTFELRMDPKAIEITMPEPTKPRPLSWEERFGNFQNVVGLGVLSLLFLVGVLLAKMLPSRDSRDQVAAAIKVQEMKNEQAAADAAPAAKSAGDSNLPVLANQGENLPAASYIFDHYRSYQRKIAFIVLASSDQMKDVMDLWLDEGDDGSRKVAAVIDCMLTEMGAAQFEKKGVDGLTLDWRIPENYKENKILSAAFKEFATMSLEIKIAYIEKAYWDLLSAKTLGEKTIKSRFSNLAQLQPAVIQRVLSTQDQKIRAVTILHLPQAKLEQVAANLTMDEKRSVIDQAFENPKIKEEELDIVDQSLNFVIKREMNQEKDVVECPSLLPNLLTALKPFEEIQLIREISMRRPDSADYLRRTYASLAFLGTWPKPKLKALFAKSKSNEILALLQAMPEIMETVMSVLPARTKAMLKEDLGKKTIGEEELDSSLQQIRRRITAMVDAGDLDLNKLGEAPPAEGLAAA